MNGAAGDAKINEDQSLPPRGVYDQTTCMPYIFSGSLSPRVYANQVAYLQHLVFPWPIISSENMPSLQDGGPLNQINATLAPNLYDNQGGNFLPQHPTFLNDKLGR